MKSNTRTTRLMMITVMSRELSASEADIVTGMHLLLTAITRNGRKLGRGRVDDDMLAKSALRNESIR
jgi:hypothetical protein